MSRFVPCVLPLLLITLLVPPAGRAQAPAPRNGQNDFDFEAGSWNTHVRLLRRPLTGSDEWLEFKGTTVVHPLLDGRANVAELKIASGADSITGVALRLYNPKSGQWSIHYANSRSGVLDKPVIGSFQNGRGEFYSQDSHDGRAILVRFVISPSGPDTWRFEQAFSADGGKTWEVNWIASDTRVK